MVSPAVGAEPHRPTGREARYPDDYVTTALLCDGTTVGVRPIRPTDEEALAAFHDHLSSDTVYRRYFTAHPHLRHWELEEFTHVDHVDRFALVAERDGDLVALASFERDPGADAAELAFVVTDRLQGLGLGTILLEHLAHAAWRRGVGRFTAMTLGDNLSMQAVFVWAGFECSRTLDHGTMDVSFDIAPSQAYLERLTARGIEAMAARVRAERPADAAGEGRGIVGIAWQSPEAAWELRRALRSSGARVRRAAGGDGRTEVAELLAYLDQEPGVEVICCQADHLARPRTLVAVARLIAARRPLVAVSPSPAAGELWRQAGAATVTDAAQAALVVGDLAHQLRDRSWAPPARGTVPPRVTTPAAGWPPPDGPGLLDPVATGALLTGHGLGTGSLASSEVLPGRRLVVGPSTLTGLSARIVNGSTPAVARVPPLTDVDAAEVARSCLPPGRPVDRVAALVVVASQLVEDDPRIERLELPLDGGEGPLVHLGPGRHPDDDPYLRCAPAGAATLRFELPPSFERRR